MSCDVGRRRGSDLVLLCLWRRPVATAPIRPLTWEPPYAAGVAQEMAKRQKDKKKKKKKNLRISLAAQCKQIQLGTMRSLTSLNELRIWRCHEQCGVGCRRGSDPALL